MDLKKFTLIFVVLLFFSCVSFNAVFADNNITCDDLLSSSDDNDLDNIGVETEDVLSSSFSLDSGSFSDIRDVISKAKDGDTIKLSGIFTSDGNLININKKLKFTSTEGVVLDGKNTSGIFYIKKNGQGSSFYNLKFINSKRFAASAVFIDAKDITFDKCVFSNNKGTGNGGGAVATIWDKNNASGLTMKNCVFKGNSAPASSGALAAFSTNFKIIDTIFENNFASNNVGRTTYEGALQAGMDGTTGIIKGCIFINNYAKTDNDQPSQAGALAVRTGTTVQDCYFENNNADYGGAVVFFSSGTVKNCTFKNNNANIKGGAIATENSQVEIIDSTFLFNTAPDAGAIFLKSPSTINNCIFENNNADKNGGAIQINEGNIEIKKSKFTNNTAKYGGAIYIGKNPNTEIISSYFNKNNADNGSAIYNKGNLELSKTDIKDNTAKSYKLESNNTSVKYGKTATIKTYLEYGDNTPGIYTTNTLKIDGNTPKLSDGAKNQEITLNISNTIYKSKTNLYGIAIFKIKTKKFTKNKYTLTLAHKKSSISTEISNTTLLKIKKDTPKKNAKKTVKKKKNKKHKKETNKKKNKKSKKKLLTKKQKKIKSKKGYKNKSKTNKKTNNAKVKHKKLKDTNKNSFIKYLMGCYGNTKKFLDTPLFTIPGYKETLKKWGVAGDILGIVADFFLGINDEGQMTIGNLALNLLSLACGAGFYIRGAKLLSRGAKLTKYTSKVSRYLKKLGAFVKNNKYIKKGVNFIKSLPGKIKKTWNSIKRFGKKLITKNKYLQKGFNLIKNNKNIKNALKHIKNIKNLPKFINTHVKKGWSIINNVKNKITKKYNQLKKKTISIKLKINKGKIHDNILKFKSKLNFKDPLKKFTNFASKVSDGISWLSNPYKKLFSTSFNKIVGKRFERQKKILNSKKVSKIVKKRVYKKYLKTGAVKYYYSNPFRKIKNLIFPDTKSIKNRLQRVVNVVNKANPIKRIFKPKHHTYHRTYRRVYSRPSRRIYRPRRIIKRNPIRHIFRPRIRPRRVLNRVKRFLGRFNIFRR